VELTKPPRISTTLIKRCEKNYGRKKHPRVHARQHCYKFFQQVGQSGLAEQRDHAALHLGFYLASWGMYRGSAFLLKHSHTIHHTVVDVFAGPFAAPLWQTDDRPLPGSSDVGQILDVAQAIRNAYQPFGKASDTLVTKVLLGTTASIPATDRFFRIGFKKADFKFSRLSISFINCVLQFWHDNEPEFHDAQCEIQKRFGFLCPPMVLVDMYFHGLGNPDGKDD
jgi:hypothetical protein